MRFAFIECASCPLILMVHGNGMFSGQSGVHWPFGPRESPLPERPNSTSRVRTGATIGICTVSVFGTWLMSGVVEKWVTPGTSTLGTEPTTRNSSIGPITGSSSSPCSASPSDSVSFGPRPSSRISSRLTSLSLEPIGKVEKSTTMS